MTDLAARHLARDPALVALLGEPVSMDGPVVPPPLPWQGDRVALARILDAPTLRADDATLVVAGQQPAVGGGALSTLVKVAHAIAIARRGATARALFWCASEDHDLGEAGHADLLLRDGRIRRVHADLGPGRASLRFRPAARWYGSLLDACREHLGPGLGAAFLTASAPAPDEGMGAWLCRLMTRLFAGHGLLAVEGHRLRPLWRDALDVAIERWPRHELATARAAAIAAGLPDAFGALDDAPLFADRPPGRVAVDADAARALLTADADILSPGAALRPALQQVALPGAISVLGPGELAYHAFIGPVYAALGAPRPLFVPRCTLALAPSWWRRAVRAWGLDADAITPATRDPGIPGAPLDATGSDALGAVDRAIAALSAQGSTEGGDDDRRRRLAGAVVRLRRGRDALAASLDRGERRSAGRLPVGALVAWLHPRGAPQERTMSLFQAIWQHGPGIADELVRAADATAPGRRSLVSL